MSPRTRWVTLALLVAVLAAGALVVGGRALERWLLALHGVH